MTEFEDQEDDALDHGAETSIDDVHDVECPYCGALNEIVVDASGGASQSYVEDCQVCCRPWEVEVTIDEDGRVQIELSEA